jgi:hypothetical protein
MTPNNSSGWFQFEGALHFSYARNVERCNRLWIGSEEGFFADGARSAPHLIG